MLSKAYIYKWLKTQRYYYCLAMATCQKNLRAVYCLGSVFAYQNPTKQPKSDLLIVVDCITLSMKGLFSRQSANASHLTAFADSRHSRIFCGDFSLLIFTQILTTIAHLESLWWLRINTCGLTRRERDKAPRAVWGTQGLYLKSATPHFPRFLMSSSALSIPKAWQETSHEEKCQVIAGTKRAVLSQAEGATSQRARGGPGPAPASESRGRDRVAALPGRLHALERQRGGNVAAVRGQRGASSVLPAVARHVAGRGSAVRHVRWHLGWRGVGRHGWCWHETADGWEAVGCLKGKGKTFLRELRHSGSAVKEAALGCCWGFVRGPGPVGTPREPPITTSLDFRGAVASLCFAFKTSYLTSALHTCPSSLSQTGTSSRGLGNTHWEQGRNRQVPPYARLPSPRLMFMDSLSMWLHLIITFESCCGRYLWWVCPISLTDHLHLLAMSPTGWSRWAVIFTQPSRFSHRVLATVARLRQVVLWPFKLGVQRPRPYQRQERWSHPSASPTPAPKEGGLSPELQRAGAGVDPEASSLERRGNEQLGEVGTSWTLS